MKSVANTYVDYSSDTDYGPDSFAGGLSLDGIGSELRALYDEMTDAETPRGLIELAERVDALAKGVTQS